MSCDPPNEVKYRLCKLTNFFRYLVSEAQGEIKFTETGNKGTTVVWGYSFFGRGVFANLLLKILVPVLWKGFMQSTLNKSKQLAESEALTSSS